MRIQYMSDLHMELWDNSRYLRANEFEVVGDVLVLAGDTFYLRDTVAPQKRSMASTASVSNTMSITRNRKSPSNNLMSLRSLHHDWIQCP
jgi:hypothetical protein